MMDQTIGNFFQVLGYVVGPIVLGIFLYYGIRQTWRRKPAAVKDVQDEAAKRLYDEDNEELARKTEAAKHSSNPIDVIERKTDTIG
jgi:hypothetical protein